MKKLLFLGLLAFSGYKIYQLGYLERLHFGSGTGSKAMAQLFIAPGCNQPCADLEEVLKSRNVTYDVIDISTPEGERYGVNQYPLTKVGKLTILGADAPRLIAVLAETYGGSALLPSERIAMRNHFDESGKPLVVMYGTSWCPYCKRERELFSAHNIAYSNVDVEASSSGKLAYDVLQGNGYPLTYVGYRRISGYKEQEILDAISDLR